MIDVHSHILPGMDDGASTLDEAIAMARIAAQENITAIVATPHSFDGVYNCHKDDILKACMVLNTVLEREAVPVRILPGQEVRLTPELLDNIDAEKILTLNNSKYILLELPTHVIPEHLIDMMRRIRYRELVPIIAHPERNPVLMTQVDLLEELIYAGALLQITAGSFTGYFGKRIKKCAMDYARMGVVHFVGSDAHAAVGRNTSIYKGLRVLNKITGENEFFQYDDLELKNVVIKA